jgi:hypothetical protein
MWPNRIVDGRLKMEDEGCPKGYKKLKIYQLFAHDYRIGRTIEHPHHLYKSFFDSYNEVILTFPPSRMEG